MAPAEPAGADQGFEKVFREAADEAEAAEQDSKSSEQNEAEAEAEAKAKAEMRGAHQAQRAKELAGLGQSSALQANLASQAKANMTAKTAKPEGKQTATNEAANVVEAVKTEGDLKISRESKSAKAADTATENSGMKTDVAKEAQKAQQTRKQAAAKQTGRLKKQQAARAQLKTEDSKHAQAKAELESVRQNLPTAVLAKSALAKPAQSADKTGNLPEGEWEIVNGTQFAQHNSKMAMMAKTTTPAPEGSVARWEELRPATSAELGGGASSQQQDLPREQAREFTAPVQAIATPVATGTAATQAFTPVPGQISATLEKIWNAVTTFRTKGADQWTVKLQADNQQLELTIRYSQGGLEIQARLGQGDGQQLAGQWNELQQSLAERGVTLRDLDREEAELPRFSEDSDDFNPSESRRHASAGEDDDEPLNWGGQEKNREEDEQTAPPRATARTENATWESWA